MSSDNKYQMLYEIGNYRQMGIFLEKELSVSSSIEEITFYHHLMKNKYEKFYIKNKIEEIKTIIELMRK
jgi:hypothetical protein